MRQIQILKRKRKQKYERRSENNGKWCDNGAKGVSKQMKCNFHLVLINDVSLVLYCI